MEVSWSMTVLVDVGGYVLAADLTAGSAPPIVFVSGIGEGRTSWQHTIPRLRAGHATLAYDRAGIGQSQPRPINDTPLPYSALAAELVALLGALHLSGPVILVAHSMGTVIARCLAAIHPQLVAGAVLLDGAVDEVILWPGSQPPQDGPGPHATLLNYEAGAVELRGAAYQPMPAIVVARTPGRWTSPEATPAVDTRWSQQQTADAEQLNAHLVIALNSGHRIQDDAMALTVLAIDAVTIAVAEGSPTATLKPDDVNAVGGSLARQPTT
jgi:pimeloyl-ACP methyl ester carboxylesterase